MGYLRRIRSRSPPVLLNYIQPVRHARSQVILVPVFIFIVSSFVRFSGLYSVIFLASDTRTYIVLLRNLRARVTSPLYSPIVHPATRASDTTNNRRRSNYARNTDFSEVANLFNVTRRPKNATGDGPIPTHSGTCVNK